MHSVHCNIRYADQMIKMKLIFDVFDVDKSGELAYPEFNEGLELLNVQFNPFQSLALFAFFDTDYSGTTRYYFITLYHTVTVTVTVAIAIAIATSVIFVAAIPTIATDQPPPSRRDRL